MIRGATIERALPGNILDCYSLYKESVKEGIWGVTGPNKDSIKEYYFKLLNELQNPFEWVFLCRRGRTYWGIAHASLVLKPWDTSYTLFLKLVYVSPKKRKVGMGKGLVDRIRVEATKVGIKRLELLCRKDLVPYWEKALNSKEALTLMTAEI